MVQHLPSTHRTHGIDNTSFYKTFSFLHYDDEFFIATGDTHAPIYHCLVGAWRLNRTGQQKAWYMGNLLSMCLTACYQVLNDSWCSFTRLVFPRSFQEVKPDSHSLLYTVFREVWGETFTLFGYLQGNTELCSFLDYCEKSLSFLNCISFSRTVIITGSNFSYFFLFLFRGSLCFKVSLREKTGLGIYCTSEWHS